MRASLVLLKERPNLRGECRVQLIVHSGSKRTRIRTGVTVLPDQWDDDRRRVKATGKNAHPKAHELNRKLVALESRARALEVDHPGASVQRAKALMGTERASPMASFVDVAMENIGRDTKIGYNTRRLWITNLNKFDAFAPHIRTQEVTSELIASFHTAMIRSGLSNSTAVWIVRRLRILYRRACKDIGKVPQSITEGIDMAVEQGAPRFVPLVRVPLLLDYATDHALRRLAVDLWCFSFLHWGIRATDLMLLKWTHINSDGWLRIPQHKTGHDKRAKIDPRALPILDRYKGGTFVFKVCGDQAGTYQQRSSRLTLINEQLRAVGKELKLPHSLTTHTARHTFVEWCIRNNVPWSRIMQMLGVKNMRAFEHYIAGFNEAEVEEVAARFAAGK